MSAFNGLISGPQTFFSRLRGGVDWVILTLAFGLMVLGAINLDSATGGQFGAPVRGQLAFMGIGFLAMGVAAAIDYRVYYRAAYPIYGIGVGLVFLVLVVGTTINSATRWLNLGLFMFQPSELVKLVVVIGLARYLQDIGPNQYVGGTGRGLRRLFVPLVMAAVPAVFVLKQPDLSTSIVLMLIVGAMLSVFELRLRGVLGGIFGGLIGFVVAWRFVLAEYQKERINVWLDPEAYPDAGGYQILQARTAVGNGGILGRGVGQGTQNLLDFVPYKASDFSFAVYAEEWGFVGSLMLIGLFVVLVLWGINLASQARDRFAAALCVGISSMMFWHAVLNMGVVLEFFPNTGLPLPFFSQGGSNVLTMMVALGVLTSVSRSRKWR